LPAQQNEQRDERVNVDDDEEEATPVAVQKVEQPVQIEVADLDTNDMKRLLHAMLQMRDCKGVFDAPVDADALGLVDYFDVIKEPMDLGTLRKRLYDGSRYYESETPKFLRDVRLVFDNARLYNGEGSWVTAAANVAGGDFERRLRRMVAPPLSRGRSRKSGSTPSKHVRREAAGPPRTSTRLSGRERTTYADIDSDDSDFLASSDDDSDSGRTHSARPARPEVLVDKILDHRVKGERSNVEKVREERELERCAVERQSSAESLSAAAPDVVTHHRAAVPAVEHCDESADYEYFVKWKNKSYLHLDWIDASVLLAEGHPGKARIRRYWNKLAELKQERIVWDPDGIELFDPSFVEVERILAWKRVAPDQCDPVALAMQEQAKEAAAQKLQASNAMVDDSNDDDAEAKDDVAQSSQKEPVTSAQEKQEEPVTGAQEKDQVTIAQADDNEMKDDTEEEETTEERVRREKEELANKRMEHVICAQERASKLDEDRLASIHKQIKDSLSADIQYLVKWKNQEHTSATWEFASALDWDDKIAEFHESCARIIPTTTPVRPNPDTWYKLPRSPVYKNANQLRSYQLESLNWLSFSWYHRRSSILADEMVCEAAKKRE
jgi:Bromodomain/Chromo (CHRromatin Organisation MOdifier) domain